MSSMTGYGSSLKGTGLKHLQLPTLSQGSSNLLGSVRGAAQPGIMGSIGQWNKLAGGGDQQTWDQLEAPAMRQFGALQGNISSRFSGAGSGARSSSGFQNTMGGAAGDLSAQLQSQRLGLQQGAQDRLMQLYQSLMRTNEFENVLAPKKMSFLKQMLLSLAGGTSQAAGSLGGMYGMKKLGLFE